MAKISTKQAIEECYSEQNKEALGIKNLDNPLRQTNRQELYDFEKEIGKELLDMNADELVELLHYFHKRGVQSTIIKNFHKNFQRVFDYYIRNYEVIVNPFYMDFRLSAKTISEYARTVNVPVKLTTELMESYIKDFRRENDSSYADYIETFVRLLYDGVNTTDEIILLKKDMIDFYTGEIHLPRATIRLRSRTLELLIRNMTVDRIKRTQRSVDLAPWKGSFLKFPVQKKNKDNPDERDLVVVRNSIPRYINEMFHGCPAKTGVMDIYNLGFYEFIVGKFGLEMMDQVIEHPGQKQINFAVSEAAKEYGIVFENIYHIKKRIAAHTELDI